MIAFYVEWCNAVDDFDFVGIVACRRRTEMISAAQAETALGFIAALHALAEIEKSEGIDPYHDAAIIAHPGWPSAVDSAEKAVATFAPFQDSRVVPPSSYDVGD